MIQQAQVSFAIAVTVHKEFRRPCNTTSAALKLSKLNGHQKHVPDIHN